MFKKMDDDKNQSGLWLSQVLQFTEDRAIFNANMRTRRRLISKSIEKVLSGDSEEIQKVNSYDARTCDDELQDILGHLQVFQTIV